MEVQVVFKAFGAEIKSEECFFLFFPFRSLVYLHMIITVDVGLCLKVCHVYLQIYTFFINIIPKNQISVLQRPEDAPVLNSTKLKREYHTNFPTSP